MRLDLPDFALVLLTGPDTPAARRFASRHFAADEIVGSLDEAAARLDARRLAVLDATGRARLNRRRAARLAKDRHAPTAALVFTGGARHGTDALQADGVALAALFRDEPEAASVASVRRVPLDVDRRELTGPFDIIGDIHGCADELETLLRRLGYRFTSEGSRGARRYGAPARQARTAVFLGDLVDRGPANPDVLRLVAALVEAGVAVWVRGNHDDKFARKLAGRDVSVSRGLAITLEQMADQPSGFAEETRAFIQAAPSHLVLDAGRLVVAHAGLPEAMHNRQSPAVWAHAMYGAPTGRRDAHGYPIRADWAAAYGGAAKVVYGHTVVDAPRWVNQAICVDTGCVFGGTLTALRYPELELVSVPAARIYYESPWSADLAAAHS